jgi:heat shock protein HtpX
MDAPAKLGLTTYRWNNNIKSIVLLLAFPLLLAALLGVIFFVLGLALIGPEGSVIYTDPFRNFGLQPVLGTRTPGDLALSAMNAWWPIVFGIAAAWVLIGYLFNDAIIHMATGAKPVAHAEAPQLYNLLENLCISRGLKMPRLYIIDTDVMNAYASGIDERSFAITVTSGLLKRLNDSEIEAVLGHELTHIIDRDCRLLIITIVFTGMISFLAQMLWRSLRLASFGRGQSRNGGGAVLLLMFISAVAFVIGYVLALILRFAISRRRELMADAGSVELTKNPDALISALQKISENAEVPHVPSEVRQLFIENPPSNFNLGGLFDTHPPIQKRIHILEELGGVAPGAMRPNPAQAAGTGAPSTKSPGFKSPWNNVDT